MAVPPDPPPNADPSEDATLDPQAAATLDPGPSEPVPLVHPDLPGVGADPGAGAAALPGAGAGAGAGPLPGGAPTIPGYDILDQLGAGGMGVVWRAVQQSTQRQVALKTTATLAGSSRSTVLRFEREIELAARLEHPHIARVYDSGTHDGVRYYAMQLVDGLPLDEYVARHDLDRRARLELMRKVALAVQHAHQRGMIHRDLKPSNILVQAPPPPPPEGSNPSAEELEPTPVLLDFGLAKPIDLAAPAPGSEGPGDPTRVTQEGQIAGTLAYMAPEQAAGKIDQLDTRTDLYALGVILYELLTGQLPHDTSGPALDVLHRIAHEDPRRPPRGSRTGLFGSRRYKSRSVGSRKASNSEDSRELFGRPQTARQTSGSTTTTCTIDRDLESLLLKCLERDPSQRYDSAAALAEDIDNYFNHNPLRACRATTVYFFRVLTS
jgi:serine/threonine protein kinase